ncbi:MULTISPECIES: hypothetical protein [Hyphomicrobiales]|jgi:hypothetical protein|nr:MULTISPECIES: hypothetical protein [Hyphomicrobiales]MBO6727990.1 hypothetical protein [Rhizobiaceae bacterium]MCV0398209.1 hypothetical protein [Rhizobiaceae bacterium]MCV0406787.1 hypothetical protein [Rhizobiaceae bacterium]NRC57033.1 hypothetical protein [Mesorhizobium sediminum]SFQ78440.1 hypothetical protein SAMN05216176_11565 [Nitratireductor indicus]
MDADLKRDLLRLFEACIAQIRSGKPGPSLLVSREFEATLLHYCECLRAEMDEATSPYPTPRVPIELIVKASAQDARDGLDDLRHWLRGAEEVIVCDPYFLHFKPTGMFPDIESYSDALVRLFPKTAIRVDLYTNSYQRTVRPAVLRALKEGRSVRHYMSSDLHDRFVIKDRSEGKSIGTSFGGFGRKFFAMTDLSPVDVASVMSELKKLCPEPVRPGRRR